MGDSSQTTNTSAFQQRHPWGPTHPGLMSLLNKIQGQIGNVGTSPLQDSTFAQLYRNLGTPNPYLGRVGALADDLFTGGKDRTGFVNNAYNQFKSQLNPTASGKFLDVQNNPYLRGAVDVTSSDIQNRVNSMFAGAGRDFSGMNMQTLARGISEGTAPMWNQAYQSERDRQMGAANSLFGGGMTTAGVLHGLDQDALKNRMAGIDVGNAYQSMQNAPLMQTLQLEQIRQGIPMQQLGMLTSMLTPIAGLGGWGNSTSTSTTTQSEDPWKTGIGLAMSALPMMFGMPPGMGSMFGGMGGLFGGGATGFSSGTLGGTGLPGYGGFY